MRDNLHSLNSGSTLPEDLTIIHGRTDMRWLNFIRQSWKETAGRPTPGDESAETTTSSVLAPHLLLGQRGEALAARYLVRSGYRLVASNFKVNVGRNRLGSIVQAEIDLVAYDGATLCFVEVKTRASDWYAAPEANVDLRKQRQITRAARAYRRVFGLAHTPYRYDVVAIVLPPADARSPLPPRVELLRNFWTDDKFRKRRWPD